MQKQAMPQAQLDALKGLIRTMMAKYPGAKLLRHKDVNSTDCPGTKFPWAEVQKYNTETTAKKEETKMTDKEFAAHEERYQAEKANQKPHPYAAEAWQSATDAGIMDGTKPQSADARTACGDFTAFRSARKGCEVNGTGFYAGGRC